MARGKLIHHGTLVLDSEGLSKSARYSSSTCPRNSRSTASAMNAENSRLPTRARIASAVPFGSDRLTRVAGPSPMLYPVSLMTQVCQTSRKSATGVRRRPAPRRSLGGRR